MKTMHLFLPALLLATVVADKQKKARTLKRKSEKSSSYNGGFYTGTAGGTSSSTQPVQTVTTVTPVQGSSQGLATDATITDSATTEPADRSDGTYSPSIVFPDGSTMTSSGLVEFFPCKSVEDSSVQEKLLDSRGDVVCQYDLCQGGCCREFDAFFLCDENNDYPKRDCLCNKNTYQHSFGLTVPVDDGGGAVVPVDVTPTNAPTPPVVRDTTTDNTAAIPVSDTGTTATGGEDCFAQTRGQDWGFHPLDTSVVPTGWMPGDCFATSHCLPSSLVGAQVCCKYKTARIMILLAFKR